MWNEHNLIFFLLLSIVQGAANVARTVDPKSKEVMYNPRYEELFAPVQGPENPHLTEQQKAPRNMLSGYVEKAHISSFNFENQRRTFHTYGYALDPSVNGETSDGHSYVGDLQAAYDTEGKTVFESPMPKKKRKQDKNDKPEDIEGFLGPWGKFENEEAVARPNPEQKAALDEILAKRNRRHKVPEDKPFEEKSVLHSKHKHLVFLTRITYSFNHFLIAVKDPLDYQGRSFLHAPHDVGVNLRSSSHPDRCFLPKAHIHTWTGHTKGISAIRLVPKTAHLLLSASMDSRVKIWEVYKERRCIRTYYGHRQAVKDVAFSNNGEQFLSAGYDRYIKLWDTETGDVVHRFTSRKIPFCVKFHPDHNKQHLFVAGTSDKKIICVSISRSMIEPGDHGNNKILISLITSCLSLSLSLSGTRAAVKLSRNTIGI